MSCCQYSRNDEEREQNSDYEEVNVTGDFLFSGNKKQNIDLCILDCKSILETIPNHIFDLFTLTVNVFTSEKIILHPCEHSWIKTNIILKPYLPITSTFTFQGVINGFSIKTSNQALIPLKEDVLKVRIQNFNQYTQNIPIGMPIGQIVIKSKNYCEL